MLENHNGDVFAAQDDRHHHRKNLWLIIAAGLVVLLISGGVFGMYGPLAKPKDDGPVIGVDDPNVGTTSRYGSGINDQTQTDESDAANGEEVTTPEPVQTGNTAATTKPKKVAKPTGKPKPSTGGSSQGGSTNNGGNQNACDQSSAGQHLFGRDVALNLDANEVDLKRVPTEYNRGIELSSDGSTFATVIEGWIYVSRDGGSSWHQRFGDDQLASDVVMTDNGQTMIATVNVFADLDYAGVQLYRSDDYGLTWETIGTLTDDPSSMYISTNGNVLTANYYDEEGNFIIGQSIDGGQTWADVSPVPETNIALYGVSPDGSSMVAEPSIGDRRGDGTPGAAAVYITNDGGYSWEEMSIGPESYYDYANAVFSSDNQHIAISAYHYDPDTSTEIHRIFLSTDGGYTWDETTPEDGMSLRDVAISRNGQTLLVAGVDPNIGIDTFYRSTDGGESWTDVGGPNEDGQWDYLTMNANATKFFIRGQTNDDGNYHTYLSSDPSSGWNELSYIAQDFDASRIDLDPDTAGQQLTIDKMTSEGWSATFDTSTSKLVFTFDEEAGSLTGEIKYIVMPTPDCDNGSGASSIFFGYYISDAA